MENKKTYFISLDKKTISEVSVPDTVEYEVYVTKEELEEFKSLIRENEQQEFSFATRNLLLKPFNEMEVDDMREESDDNLMKEFQFMYRHGTLETKEKLNEVGFDTKSK